MRKEYQDMCEWSVWGAHTPTCDLWAARYRVADLLLLGFGVGVTVVAVLPLCCQTAHLPHLEAFSTGPGALGTQAEKE